MIISTMLSIHNVLLESLKSKIGILNAIMLAFDPLKMGGGHTTNQAFGLEMGGTKPRRCYVCNNVGHIAKLCPEVKHKQTMSTDASVLQVQVRSNCNALEVQVGSDSSQVAQ